MHMVHDRRARLANPQRPIRVTGAATTTIWDGFIAALSLTSEGWAFIRADTVHLVDAGHGLLGRRLAGHLAVPFLEAA